jgi:hypothetical protein
MEYVDAVLYRSIYHLKCKGSYGGSNTQYAVRGTRGTSGFQSRTGILLKPNLGSLYNGWDVAVNH